MDRKMTVIYAVPVIPCRVRANVGMCPGSKYRFCVPQNRRACQRTAGHSNGKEVHL